MFGVYNLIKCAPVASFSTYYEVTQKIDWRAICEEYGLESDIKDFISVSIFSLFNNPELFSIEVNNIFIKESSSKTTTRFLF